MSMVDLQQSTDPFTRKLFSIITSAPTKTMLGDEIYVPTASQCHEITSLLYEETISRMGTFETLDEARKSCEQHLAGDSLYNERTGIGTLTDPSVFTHSTIPITISPMEQTNLYASGGLPADIIDKKSRAMCSEGISFHAIDTSFWNNDRIQVLEESAYTTGLNDCLGDAICDGLVYGGSLVFPLLSHDTPSSIYHPFKCEKGEIDRWVNVDRWNVVAVPSYEPTQADYINPKTVFITTSALEVSTTRCALIRPRPMPYWAVIQNLGWSPSDFSGWMRAYYGYAITMQSIPVMAQQMSLLLYKMPLDALQATVGAREVEKLMSINEKKMSEWSVTSPKAVNMIGEVEVVNRSYAGFDQFIGAMKSHLAAECGLPEPSLWHTPNKGFSDNTTESLLKQSEKLRLSQKNIERSLNNIKNVLVAHTFGMDSEEYQRVIELHTVLNKPNVSTEKDMAEVGARFAASVSSFASSGVAPNTAIELSRPFFPSIKITDELVANVKKEYDEAVLRADTLGAGSNFTNKTQEPNLGKFTKGGGV